ncbi:TadE/TadG family type IV pilus assembly protein [Pantoea sp. 18069]|uniref:TadE/TadG family type IV pilus assembly protein n=1 Tax=Pantoea sp. 18069 TaxID=2681415 RepID=UPI00190F72B1|nr:TadE/TadG family type IV pilus assembly protein [Pantoea sp. 18069]
MPLPPRTSAPPRRQRGVYALEWALVFIVFFMLLYAILSFGLGFLVRESMQWAVEDGARAALQFKTSRTDRQARALAVVKNNLDWLPAQLKGTIDSNFSFMVCELNNNANCPEDLVCDLDKNAPCMVQVRLTLPYAQHAFTPSLTMGLLEVAMPDLQAQAQIVVDQKGF